MVGETIFEQSTDDMIWPEIIMVMTYLKNLKSTQVLEGFISPF